MRSSLSAGIPGRIEPCPTTADGAGTKHGYRTLQARLNHQWPAARRPRCASPATRCQDRIRANESLASRVIKLPGICRSTSWRSAMAQPKIAACTPSVQGASGQEENTGWGPSAQSRQVPARGLPGGRIGWSPGNGPPLTCAYCARGPASRGAQKSTSRFRRCGHCGTSRSEVTDEQDQDQNSQAGQARGHVPYRTSWRRCEVGGPPAAVGSSWLGAWQPAAGLTRSRHATVTSMGR